ncbi:IS3 family transposase [Streptomyces sp. NPDC051940]|uniref:IS3 family transposase n=1 Tax=Streptomyces sp. NPDC051940 TaxID=3155675 RepID=UPI0034479EF1
MPSRCASGCAGRGRARRCRRSTPVRQARAADDAALTEQIRAIHGEAKGAYGVPRVTRELREDGPAVNHKRVARLMRAAGISGRHLRKGKRTTIPDARAPKAPDLLQRDFTAPRPGVRGGRRRVSLRPRHRRLRVGLRETWHTPVHGALRIELCRCAG